MSMRLSDSAMTLLPSGYRLRACPSHDARRGCHPADTHGWFAAAARRGVTAARGRTATVSGTGSIRVRRPALTVGVRERACEDVDLLGQRQDLPREVEQLDVLLVLLLNQRPLLIGD